VSDPFYRPPPGLPTFHGRVSTDRSDRGFENYHKLITAHYSIRIFLDGREQRPVTADPEAGIIEIHQGSQVFTLNGHVEVRLERKPPS